MTKTHMIREHGRSLGRRGGEVGGGSREGALLVGNQVLQLISITKNTKTNDKHTKKSVRGEQRGGTSSRESSGVIDLQQQKLTKKETNK